MNAAIITIGNELLSGFTLDSNSTWIGRKLLDIGINTTIKLTVGDSVPEIIQGLKIGSKKCDVILCTGGLGPTSDDVTRSAFCDFFNATLEFDETYFNELKKRFERRGLLMPECNRDQAYVPNKGNVIPNPVGSALGLKFVSNSKYFFILPGVPTEMKAMMEQSVLPVLSDLSNRKHRITTIRTTGIMESAIYDKIKDILEDLKEVNVAFIPGFMGVDIRLESEKEDVVDSIIDKIYNRIESYIYAEGWETLEEVVGRLLREHAFTISTAESCTGGLLSDRLTNVSGSSDYFMGGIITYSNESKIALLGVQKDTILEYGAVSEETAYEMAQGVRGVFQTNLGISITGIAGPSGGTTEKPIGLTYIGLDFSGDIVVKQYIFSNDRRFNKELASQAALNLVRLALL